MGFQKMRKNGFVPVYSIMENDILNEYMFRILIFSFAVIIILTGWSQEVFAKKYSKGTFLYNSQTSEYFYVKPQNGKEVLLGTNEQLSESIRSISQKVNPKNVLRVPIKSFSFYSKGTDSDDDGLSDEFENFIGTHALKNDSDGDGYADKHELLNAYSPLSKQKKKIAYHKKPFLVFKSGLFFSSTKSKGILYVNPSNSRFVFFENTELFGEFIKKNAKPMPIQSLAKTSAPPVIVSPVAKPSESPVITPSPTLSPSPSPIPSVSPKPTPSLTPTPSSTPVVAPSPTPIVISTPSPIPVVTPSPSPTPTLSPVFTPSPIITPQPTPSPTPLVIDDTEPVRDESKIECDTSADQFRETGIMKCGHILWKLSSQNAKLFTSDPRGYFMKYDDLYYFYKDFMGGHEPWQEMITILEDPKLSYPATANYTDSVINVTPLFVKEQFVYLANMPSKPLNPSFMHEVGHIFGLSSSNKNAYIWKDLSEEHANMVGILPYLMVHDGQFKMAVDFWCRNKLKTAWPCNAYFKNFEDYPEWLGANKDLEEYQKNKETFDTLFINPPSNQSIHKRGGKFQTMLTTLYSEFKQQGKEKEFYEAYKKTQQFYIVHETYFSESVKFNLFLDKPNVIIKKMNIYLLLLSLYSKTNLLDRFEKDWRFPILPETKDAYTKIGEKLFSDQAILDGMKEYLNK